jgi:hypothetical protein
VNAVIAYLSDPYTGIFWFCIAAVFVANELHGRRQRSIRLVHRKPQAPACGSTYESVAPDDEFPLVREARTVVTRRDDLREFFWQ